MRSAPIPSSSALFRTEPRDLALIAPVRPEHVPRLLPGDCIRPNPGQPRKHVHEARIEDLAASLRTHGVLQPVIVRPVGNPRPSDSDPIYELVAGERRWRAAKLAGIGEIPVIIRDVANGDMLELALVENLHRQDLNPIEKARAYRTLRERGLSHEEIGAIAGDEPRTIRYAIQLLDLCPEALALLESGVLDGSHGKALLSVTDPVVQANLAREAGEKRWTVRQLQDRIRRLKPKRPRAGHHKFRNRGTAATPAFTST